MERIEQEPIGKIGDNKPPLRARLEINYTDLRKRATELLEAFARAPETIPDDATQGKIGDLYRLLATCSSKAEALRKDEKEPFIADGKAVDAFFKDIADPLDKAMFALKLRSTTYSNVKIAAERKRLADEETAKRLEAAKALQAAQKAADAGKGKAADKALEKAAAASAAAQQAQEAAQAAPAELARTRGEHATVSTQTRWVHEVTDWAAIPLETLRPFLSRDEIEKAIRNFVRQNKDAVPLAGVRIFQSTASTFR